MERDILKIDDEKFSALYIVPNMIKSNAEVGESVSVLGYPKPSIMGGEIKLFAKSH
ncbi:MAG: hypothetical protein KKD31_08230 [Bacteroidetes bacterium]|nr:hypothetical protein [Bacteroidota bacterium]